MSSMARPSSIAPASEPATREVAESRLTVVSGRILFAALLLVIALSPFEAGYPPLGRFLWATFTNLEVSLFLLAGAWLFKMAVDGPARSRFVRLPLLLPILALVAASVLSTVLGEYRSLGVQFVYRLLMGALVFASVYEAVRGRRRLLAALGTMAGAGFISVVLGLLEFAPALNIQPWLRAFKPQPTTVGGMLRLSGSFEYANGAAAYFEMAVPVLISMAVLFGSRRLVAMMFGEGRVSERRRIALLALLFVGAGVYVIALILTFSRAALVGLAVALAVFGLAALLRRKGEGRWLAPVIWRTLGVGAAVMLLAGLFVFATQPMFRLRLVTQNDRDWYRAAITAEPLSSLSARQVVTVPVTVRNEGQLTWPAGGVLPIRLSYHWLDAQKDVYLLFDGARTAFPHDVAPGETVSVLAIVQAPATPGEYRLQWDIVHENVTWFDRKEGITAEVRSYSVAPGQVVAGQKPLPVTVPAPLEVAAVSDTASIERLKLWKTAWAMFKDHPLTGVGPDGFRNLYGEYAGVSQWNKNIYTNNMYIEMFTNLGLLGGLAFLWLAGLALLKAARNMLRETPGPMWVLGVGTTAAVVAFFFHGVVDYFLFATPIYVLFWFLMSVSVSWPALAARAPEREMVNPA